MVYSEDVDSVIVPYDALGGPAVLSFISSADSKLIVAVTENKTVMDFGPEELKKSKNIVTVSSYAEAAGVILAHKNGID